MPLIQSLPQECLENILKLVGEEPNSNLFSCILVNRAWRDRSLSLLWSRPFNELTPISQGVKLMSTYISCLSASQKQYLNSHGIYLRQNPTPTTNYPERLRELQYEILERYTRFWLLRNIYSEDSLEDLDAILDSLEYSEFECINNDPLKRLLSCLFSMFIEKSVNLTYFSFYSCGELCLDLPELPTWMSPVTSLPMRTSYSNNWLRTLNTFICEIDDDELHLPNLLTFMEILSRQCKVLKTIDFTWKNQNENDVDVCNYLIEIIRQQQLEEIRLNVDDIDIDRMIEVLIDTQRQSLMNIQFENVNFSGTSYTNATHLHNSLTEFCRLERIYLINCHGLILGESFTIDMK